MLRTFSMLLTATLFLGCNQQNETRPVNAGPSVSTPTSTSADNNTPAVEPDNTAKNERDRSSTAKTPIDQNENQTDVQITADIRTKIRDANLSLNANNVKIITQDRHVTLRGPVDSAGEKERIESLAKTVAGNHVESFLEVIGER